MKLERLWFGDWFVNMGRRSARAFCRLHWPLLRMRGRYSRSLAIPKSMLRRRYTGVGRLSPWLQVAIRDFDDPGHGQCGHRP